MLRTVAGCSSTNKQTLFASSLLVVVVAALLLIAPVAAFPFGRTSAVTELTPSTLTAFVNTHKPVVVLFYAPWCGHCKQFHSDYERFAESAKGAIRVGAINADEHSSVSGQFGIRGFPTIKYWRMGSKSLNAPEEYQSQRTAGAVQQFMMTSVKTDRVRTDVKSVEALKQAVLAAPKQRAAVLFSAKSKVPPIFSIVSYSPKLQELPFIFIDGTVAAEVAAAFGIDTVPKVAVVRTTEGEFDAVPYAGSGIAYEPVAKFFLTVAEGTEGEAGAGAAPLHNLDGTADGQQQQQPIRARSGRKALPVGPAVFDPAATLTDFCAPPESLAQRVKGAAVWCVIALSPRVDLKQVHARYQHEPFLFIDASAAGVKGVAASLQESLGGLTLEDFGLDAREDGDAAVLLIRKTKPNVVRVRGFAGVDTAAALNGIIEKVVGGEVTTRQRKLQE